MIFQSKYNFNLCKLIWKFCLQNVSHFVSASFYHQYSAVKTFSMVLSVQQREKESILINEIINTCFYLLFPEMQLPWIALEFCAEHSSETWSFDWCKSRNVWCGVADFNPWTAGNAWAHTQHCSYWCPGAKAPGHKYPKCGLHIHIIEPLSYT